MFLFGGTSPFSNTNTHGIQDYVTDENLQGLDVKLMDHSDLHILDFAPSLRTLCLLVVIQNHLEETWLPEDIKLELRAMTTNNSISRQLNNTG